MNGNTHATQEEANAASNPIKPITPTTTTPTATNDKTKDNGL